MRSAILICLSLILGYAATAQLTLLPQFGLENSRTAIAIDKASSFSPLGGKLSPQAALRLEYLFKKSHSGPFLGLATSRSIVNYEFSDPASGLSDYTATRGATQLRLEGGYQLASKPIYFKKATATKSTATSQYQNSQHHSGCSRSYAQSSCGNKASKTTTAAKDTRSWVRILPSLGAAYIPGTPQDDIYKATSATYAYNAGNWTTAVLGGVGFEFGKGTQSKYNISLNYLKGLGNLDTKTLTTMSGNKPITTTMESSTTSWNLRVGIPIHFAKKQPVEKQQVTPKTYSPQHRCGEYKSQYKGHCTGRYS
jgi:hypothetical protein